ncbi:MAG: ABC transporter substrate-binding protein [Thermoplasmata archaeon]|nr:ABC transporter substrate-binding protein [Thermoplasmata archaeon]
MADNKIIAVVVAVIIVVAGVGAYFLLNNGDDSEYRSSNLEGRLLIMGNANNDDYLDEQDIDKLNEIIEQNLDWKTDYPLADANCDGSITEADVEMVQRMVNREAMTINYAYLSSGELVTSSISYPIKNVIAVGDNVVLGLKTLGAESKIVGIALSDSDDPLYSDVSSITSVRGSSTTVPSISLISTVADADTVLVTSTSSRYVTNEAEVVASGVSVVRFNVDGGESGLESMMGTLTMGYLLGLEDEANEYVRFCDSILSDVADKVSSVTTKVTCIATNRTSNVSGVSSEYYQIPVLAGGVNVITADTTYTSWTAGMDWLYAYDFDYIIHSTSLGYGQVDAAAEYSTYSTNFTNLQAYEDGNFVLINANVPAPIRVAYIAAIFYPDIFGEDYGEKLHQEFIDTFIGNLSGSYDVTTDGTFVVTSH